MLFPSGQGPLTVSEKFLGRSCPYLHLSFTYSAQPKKIKIKTLSATYMWDPKREKKLSLSPSSPLSVSGRNRSSSPPASSSSGQQKGAAATFTTSSPAHARLFCAESPRNHLGSVLPCPSVHAVGVVVRGQSQLEAQKTHLLSSPLPIECYL